MGEEAPRDGVEGTDQLREELGEVPTFLLNVRMVPHVVHMIPREQAPGPRPQNVHGLGEEEAGLFEAGSVTDGLIEINDAVLDVSLLDASEDDLL